MPVPTCPTILTHCRWLSGMSKTHRLRETVSMLMAVAKCRRASFLVDRLPRTIALVSALARLQLEQLEHRPQGHPNQFDIFGRELFKLLAGAHEAIYGCKPLTRIKSGETIGGSIDWAKAVIRRAACDRDLTAPRAVLRQRKRRCLRGPGSAVSRSGPRDSRALRRPFQSLGQSAPRRIGDRLETGWRDWKQQVIASAP